MLPSPSTVLILILLFTLLFLHRRIPAMLKGLGRSIAGVRDVGRGLTSDADDDGSLAVFEIKAGAAVAGKYLSAVPLSSADQLTSHVDAVGARLLRLVRRAEIPYRFVMTAEPEPKAMAIPGGTVIVSRPLVELCRDDSELAGLLAHEIVHIDLKHAVRHLAKQTALNAGVKLLQMRRTLLARAVQGFDGFVQRGYTEEQEFDADMWSVRLAEQAGFDGHGLLRLLERLQPLLPNETEGRSSSDSCFSSRAGLAERILRLRRLAT